MKSRKSAAKRHSRPRDIRKLHPISQQMRQFSALLESELLTWPNTTAKPMFGFRAIYRGQKIFAALPKSREFDPAGSILLKFNLMPETLRKQMESDPRFGSWAHSSIHRWISFTLNSGADIRDALWWLEQAHIHAKGRTSR